MRPGASAISASVAGDDALGMLRPHHLLPAVAVAALALPAAASAQDFCVNSAPGCTGLSIKANTLQTWLGTAAANGTDDRFFFGPGTIDQGPLTYNSNEPVQLIGAGQGKTTLTSSVAGSPTLTFGNNADSEVSGMTLAATGNATGALRLFGARASDIEARSQGGGGDGPIMLFDGSRIDHVNATDSDTWAVGVISGTVTIADSTIVGGAQPAVFSQGSDVSVVRDRLYGISGVGVIGGTTTVTDTLIDTTHSAGAITAGAITIPQSPSTTARLVIDRSTIVGNGPGDSEHFGIYGGTQQPGQSVQVTATNTVVSGFGLPVVRAGSAGAPANIIASHDAYGAPVGPNETGDGTLSQDHIIKALPRFASVPDGDYTLAADSPLIDAGNDEMLDAGAVDLLGGARLTDGNGDCRAVVDIGAFEHATLDAPQCHPAPAPAPAPAPVAPSGQVTPPSGVGALVGKASLPSTLRVSGLKVAPKRIHRGHKAKVAFVVSRKATVAIKVINKKHKTVLKLKLTKSGTLAKHLKLKPGTYTVTAVAIDAKGLRSKAATARFTVVK